MSKLSNAFDKSGASSGNIDSNANLSQSSIMKKNIREKLLKLNDKTKENEQITKQLTKRQKLELEFSRIRYTLPFIVYQRVNLWKYLDFIALNFHLITALVTLYLCVNWQVSVIMLV